MSKPGTPERPRRSILKPGAVGLAVPGAGGWFASYRTEKGARAVPAGSATLDARARTMLAKLANAIAEVVGAADQAVGNLSPHKVEELQDLYALRGPTPARALLIGQWTGWADATRDDLARMLTGLRSSSVTLRRVVCMSPRDRVAGSDPCVPDTWGQVGYPGPMIRGPGVDVWATGALHHEHPYHLQRLHARQGPDTRGRCGCHRQGGQRPATHQRPGLRRAAGARGGRRHHRQLDHQLPRAGHCAEWRSFDFPDAEFLALPTVSVTTSTPWTSRSTFVGPLLLTVMCAARIENQALTVRSLDDSAVMIPCSDLVRFGVILAHSQNGKHLDNKRWGPLWTRYSRDEYPGELAGPVAESRFIWQVNRIEI